MIHNLMAVFPHMEMTAAKGHLGVPRAMALPRGFAGIGDWYRRSPLTWATKPEAIERP